MSINKIPKSYNCNYAAIFVISSCDYMTPFLIIVICNCCVVFKISDCIYAVETFSHS
jgi:hypothetical protein